MSDHDNETELNQDDYYLEVYGMTYQQYIDETAVHVYEPHPKEIEFWELGDPPETDLADYPDALEWETKRDNQFSIENELGFEIDLDDCMEY